VERRALPEPSALVQLGDLFAGYAETMAVSG